LATGACLLHRVDECPQHPRGIWFPIADNHHHLHNPIIDRPTDNIQATINPQTIPGKPGVNRKPPIRFPASNNRYLHNLINEQTAHPNNQRTSIQSDYWSPIGSQAKANLVDGYTHLVTDRVRAGWSCNLVTFLFSQLPGPRTAVISRMKDEVHRIYSTLLTRVHRKPRMASTDELPVLIGAMDLPVYKREGIWTDRPLQRRAPCPRPAAYATGFPLEGLSGGSLPGKTRSVCSVGKLHQADRCPASR
jgi:hypothetical protein